MVAAWCRVRSARRGARSAAAVASAARHRRLSPCRLHAATNTAINGRCMVAAWCRVRSAKREARSATCTSPPIHGVAPAVRGVAHVMGHSIQIRRAATQLRGSWPFVRRVTRSHLSADSRSCAGNARSCTRDGPLHSNPASGYATPQFVAVERAAASQPPQDGTCRASLMCCFVFLPWGFDGARAGAR